MAGILNYEYQESGVDFLMLNDVMVNVTQMGMILKLNPELLLKTNGAVSLVNVVSNRAISKRIVLGLMSINNIYHA